MRRVPTLSVLVSAAAVAVVQVLGSIGATSGQTDRRSLDVLAVVLLLVGPVALVFRERAPHVVALVAIAATAVFVGRGHAYGPVFTGPVVAMFLAGLTPHRRRTWLVGVAAVGAMLLAQIVDLQRDGGVSWLHLGLVAGWVTALVAAAEITRNRRDQVSERARVAGEEDRRRAGEQRLRIAQELHDILAHDISLINVQAGVALHLVDEQPEQARSALANIKEASRDALHELRSALDVLRTGDDAPRAPAPRLHDLPALVAVVRAGGLDVHLHGPGEFPPLPASVELAAYRIVQEALTNITRHAQASTVTVVVRVDDDVTVEVTDDGVGGVPGPGRGITGMRERASSLGGTLEAGTGPGGGFRVAARLPA